MVGFAKFHKSLPPPLRVVSCPGWAPSINVLTMQELVGYSLARSTTITDYPANEQDKEFAPLTSSPPRRYAMLGDSPTFFFRLGAKMWGSSPLLGLQL